MHSACESYQCLFLCISGAPFSSTSRVQASVHLQRRTRCPTTHLILLVFRTGTGWNENFQMGSACCVWPSLKHLCEFVSFFISVRIFGQSRGKRPCARWYSHTRRNSPLK